MKRHKGLGTLVEKDRKDYEKYSDYTSTKWF